MNTKVYLFSALTKSNRTLPSDTPRVHIGYNIIIIYNTVDLMI